MSTHRSSWKRRERDAASLFGARRRVLSGSSGRAEVDGDDADHPRLWIEVKLRAASAVRSLWEKTRAAASKGRKRPVLALYDKGKQGALLVVHEDDLAAAAAEWLAARDEADILEFEAAVRRLRLDITED